MVYHEGEPWSDTEGGNGPFQFGYEFKYWYQSRPVCTGLHLPMGAEQAINTRPTCPLAIRARKAAAPQVGQQPHCQTGAGQTGRAAGSRQVGRAVQPCDCLTEDKTWDKTIMTAVLVKASFGRQAGRHQQHPPGPRRRRSTRAGARRRTTRRTAASSPPAPPCRESDRQGAGEGERERDQQPCQHHPCQQQRTTPNKRAAWAVPGRQRVMQPATCSRSGV